VIRIDGRCPDRQALFDIGAARPLAGLAVALPLTAVGLYLSPAVPRSSLPSDLVALGSSPLIRAMSWAIHGPVPAGSILSWHPVLMAGWIGPFVTAVNLLPAGQLDGEHVIYALVGPRAARRLGQAAVVVLAACALFRFVGWVASIALLLTLELRHPAPVDATKPLGRLRTGLGLATLALGLACFLPTPLEGLDLLSLVAPHIFSSPIGRGP
jgi:membrane-associated protease RseP (regulator of RpoE activity)